MPASGDLDTGKAVLRVYINVQDWRDAYVFFKHEDKGAAPKLAAQFMTLLED